MVAHSVGSERSKAGVCPKIALGVVASSADPLSERLLLYATL